MTECLWFDFVSGLLLLCTRFNFLHQSGLRNPSCTVSGSSDTAPQQPGPLPSVFQKAYQTKRLTYWVDLCERYSWLLGPARSVNGRFSSIARERGFGVVGLGFGLPRLEVSFPGPFRGLRCWCW